MIPVETKRLIVEHIARRSCAVCGTCGGANWALLDDYLIMVPAAYAGGANFSPYPGKVTPFVAMACSVCGTTRLHLALPLLAAIGQVGAMPGMMPAQTTEPAQGFVPEMVTYFSFACRACGHKAPELMLTRRRGDGGDACPKCGSNQIGFTARRLHTPHDPPDPAKEA